MSCFSGNKIRSGATAWCFEEPRPFHTISHWHLPSDSKMTAIAPNFASVSKAGRRENVNPGLFSFLGRKQNFSQNSSLPKISICTLLARTRPCGLCQGVWIKGAHAKHIATPKLRSREWRHGVSLSFPFSEPCRLKVVMLSQAWFSASDFSV